MKIRMGDLMEKKTIYLKETSIYLTTLEGDARKNLSDNMVKRYHKLAGQILIEISLAC